MANRGSGNEARARVSSSTMIEFYASGASFGDFSPNGGNAKTTRLLFLGPGTN